MHTPIYAAGTRAVPAPDLLPTDLIDTQAAAQSIGVSLSTIHRWIGRGRLRAWKAVGRLRVSLAELRALLTPVPPRAGLPRPEPGAQAQRAIDRETEAILARAGFLED